ncbi:MAG: L-rhamnose/proton symporter RhaT [Bacteroidales bacterium]
MDANPLSGLFLIAIGALSAASFYVPFNKVRNMAWEVYWLIAGLFSWIVVPVIIALVTVPSLFKLYGTMPVGDLFWPFLFGLLYGFGGLTFGLSMRYLGLSLGYALTLGIIAVFGTLIPPLINGKISEMFSSTGGQITLAGIGITVLGIILTGRAGIMKDRLLSEEMKTKTIREFNLKKGALVALFAGIMSACFAFGIEAGRPISEKAVSMGVNPLWRQNPVYVIMLVGTFITNVIWCIILGVKNKTLGDFFKATPLVLIKNYLFSALAGTLWYVQFLLYGMGESKMGRFSFAAWSILMALSIVFSTCWGIYRNEWKDSGKRISTILIIGLIVLVIASFIIGLAGRY